MLTSVILSGETVSFRCPEDLPTAACVASGDPLLLEVLKRHRPERLLEVGSCFGLAGLAALERRWCTSVVWVMRDLVGGRALRETLGEARLSGGEVILGEGPLEAPERPFDAVIIHQQPSRPLTEILLRQGAARLSEGGMLFLAGATNKGVKGSESVVRSVCTVSGTDATARRLRVVSGRSPRPDQVLRAVAPRTCHTADIMGTNITWVTTPGVFSADGLDPATELLLQTVALPHRGRILDLGCGAGVIGLWCARGMPHIEVTMVDSDVASVRCSEEGVRRNGFEHVRVLLSDGADAVRGERFDVVITNPPVHRGGERHLALVESFAREAARSIGRKGRLWLVTAPTVPIHRTLRELFTDVRLAAGNGRFCVWDAIRRPVQRRERVAARW